MKCVQLTAIFVLVFIVFAAPSCLGGDDQTMLRVFSRTLHEEIGAVRGDLMSVEDPLERQRLESWLSQAEIIVRKIDQQIQTAEPGAAGLGVMEGVAVAVGSFFPPAMVLLPVIRAWRAARRHRELTFESIDAVGGPKNPDAARTVLSRDPGAYAAFRRYREKNGRPPAMEPTSSMDPTPA